MPHRQNNQSFYHSMIEISILLLRISIRDCDSYSRILYIMHYGKLICQRNPSYFTLQSKQLLMETGTKRLKELNKLTFPHTLHQWSHLRKNTLLPRSFTKCHDYVKPVKIVLEPWCLTCSNLERGTFCWWNRRMESAWPLMTASAALSKNSSNKKQSYTSSYQRKAQKCII